MCHVPLQPRGEGPPSVHPGQLFYGKPACLSPPPSNFAALFLPHPLRARSHDVFVSTVDKTGSSLGPPISPPPWGDMADEWRDPQTVHAYNLSLLFGGRPVIATQIAPCFQKDLLLYPKAWPTAPKKKKKKKASIRLHGVIFVRRMKWNVFHLLGVILEGTRDGF